MATLPLFEDKGQAQHEMNLLSLNNITFMGA